MGDDGSSGSSGAGPAEESRTVIGPVSLPLHEAQRAREEDRGPAWSRSLVLTAGRGVALEGELEPDERPLQEHQHRALAALARWWAGPERTGVLCLPTGAGKTRTGVTFALRHALRSGPVLWLAHREELVSQAVGAFARCGAESPHVFTVGRYQAGARKVSHYADVVVASIPTLVASPDALQQLLSQQGGRISLVIVDECHHAVARTWAGVLARVAAAVPAVRVLGLSATPTRSSLREDHELARLLGDIVFEQSPLELIHRGVLARPRFVIVDTHLRFNASAEERSDFEQFRDLPDGVIERIAQSEARNTQILNTYMEHAAAWGPTLMFVANLRQAARFVEELHQRSIPAAQVRGDATRTERRRIIAQFADGRLFVLVNVGVLTEGTDLPSVRTVFIARPTQSRVLFQQMAGRAMRGAHAGGNAECNIVSFHDVVVGLGAQPYSTSFVEERAAWDAIVGEPEEPPEVPTSRGESPASPRPARPVAMVGPGVGNAPAPNVDAPLVGWWELSAEPGRGVVRLPVFAPDDAAIREWVEGLSRGEIASARPPERFTSRARYVAFARELAQHRDRPLRFVPIETATGHAQSALVTSFLEEARTLVSVVQVTPPPRQVGPAPVASGHEALPIRADTHRELVSTGSTGTLVTRDAELAAQRTAVTGTTPPNPPSGEQHATTVAPRAPAGTTSIDQGQPGHDGHAPALPGTALLAGLAAILAKVPARDRRGALASAYPAFAAQFATLAEFDAAVSGATASAAVAPHRSSTAEHGILELLAAAPEPMRKVDILAQLELTDSQWTRAARRLLDQGAIRCYGRGRSARYAITPSGLASIAHTE